MACRLSLPASIPCWSLAHQLTLGSHTCSEASVTDVEPPVGWGLWTGLRGSRVGCRTLTEQLCAARGLACLPVLSEIWGGGCCQHPPLLGTQGQGGCSGHTPDLWNADLSGGGSYHFISLPAIPTPAHV